MSSTPVDEIKNRLDIVDFIKGYIKLEKAGRNYKANCPFHNEKTPSFMVSSERQMWKCFGCGKGGSIFDFLMEMDGLEFGDALRILAQRAGVELKKINPELSAQLKTEKSRLYEICDLAVRFYVKQLTDSQAGRQIKKYLIKRGLKPETIKEWEIGFAPNQWRSLSDFLRNRGYHQAEIIKSGLGIAKENEENNIFDRFRDRIMFPIFDINGLAVGFTGRENPNQSDERMGKYVNTPNTLLYDKGRILYGLDRAKMDIRQKDLCVLVEGQMDVIMSHQAGVKNVIASSGTAISLEQLKIIKRYTENLVTSFDADVAGEIAAKRSLELAIQSGFNVKVATVMVGKDPADCVLQNPVFWQDSILKAQGIVEFYFKTAFAKFNPETAQGKKQISGIILPIIKRIPNKIEQSHWLDELSGRLKVPENIIIEEMNKLKEAMPSYAAQTTLESDKSDKINLEEYALGLLLNNPAVISEIKKAPCAIFTNNSLAEIFKALKKQESGDAEEIKKNIGPHLQERLNYLMFNAETHQSISGAREEVGSPQKEIQACFCHLKNRYLQRELDRVCAEIKSAESKQDKETLKKLFEEFNQITKQINSDGF